jgi:hypothetical protein
MTSTSSIPEHAELCKAKLARLAKEDGNQPGDPVKLVEIILDIVRHEGAASGKEIPFRLPLGSDCYEDIKTKCEETLRLLDGWGPIIRSTDHDDLN